MDIQDVALAKTAFCVQNVVVVNVIELATIAMVEITNVVLIQNIMIAVITMIAVTGQTEPLIGKTVLALLLIRHM